MDKMLQEQKDLQLQKLQEEIAALKKHNKKLKKEKAQRRKRKKFEED
jgi:hypothetical protein